MLALEQVVKHYHTAREEIKAVDGVTLEVRPGEMVALHGPSGSGKTTLLLLIAGLLRPERGMIHFDGRDICALSDGEASDYRLGEVGFVYQKPHLMPRVSVIENAAIKLVHGGVRMRDAQARALPWVERVGLSDRQHHTTEELSSGERQRVSIAKTLACEPRLVLADEPTGNLDSARSHDIVQLLRSVAHDRGACVLLVTHDLEAAALADRHLTLRDGVLIDSLDTARGSGSRTDGASPQTAAGRQPGYSPTAT